MKALLFLAVLMLPVSALALSDSAIEFCFTTADPKACMHAVSADVQQRQTENWREREYNHQLDMARVQANGLMLFGTGPAFINGMNQNLLRMQQPYVSTPYFQYSNGHQ